jgi:hypothetical protein
MKKIVFVALLGVISLYSQAQIVWGIRAGVGYTTSQSSDGVKTKGNMSFEIGPTAYHSFSENFYLNTGLNFSLKRFGDSNDTNESFGGMNYYSCEVPVNLGTRFNLGNTSIYTQAGPFIGVKFHESISFSESIDGVNNIGTDFMNRLNYGIGAAVGVDIKKFKIELGYQKGLANIISDKFWKILKEADIDDIDLDGNEKLYLNTLFIGVSYVF